MLHMLIAVQSVRDWLGGTYVVVVGKRMLRALDVSCCRMGSLNNLNWRQRLVARQV